MELPNNLNHSIDWKKLDEVIKTGLGNEKSGHDYEHTLRVLSIALEIAKTEKVDLDVLVAACLLHDIAFKSGFVKDHHLRGAEEAEPILIEIGFPKDKIQAVKIAIEDHVGMIGQPIRTESSLQIESKILRDADNIDALGAVGLIRQISFCIQNKIPYFKSIEDGLNDSIYGGTKEILTWPDKMLLPQSKLMAEKRTEIMKKFIEELKEENKDLYNKK